MGDRFSRGTRERRRTSLGQRRFTDECLSQQNILKVEPRRESVESLAASWAVGRRWLDGRSLFAREARGRAN